MAEFARETQAEKAHLVDPYMCDPEPLFAWVADSTLKEVEVRARGRSIAARRAYQAAKDHLGLNREELRRCRWDLAYRPLKANRELLEQLDGADNTGRARHIVLAEIRRMMQPDQPYAAMVRYFVRVQWRLELGEADD